MTRREALCKMGAGFGMLSLASLLGDTIARADAPEAKASWMIQEPGFKPRAKHVIFLFMNGGLSQIDSFDHKPMLAVSRRMRGRYVLCAFGFHGDSQP
jgi:hypothetical protein